MARSRSTGGSTPQNSAPEGSTPKNISATGKSPRERIIDAFMAILADKPFESITLIEVASTAGVTLADMRAEFGSTLGIVAAHIKAVDRAVLAGGDDDMVEESARERLFDVLMRRLELLNEHRAAIRSLLRSARRNPPLALALNGFAVQSQQWMLAAADISASGPKGMIRAQGLALMFANVLQTWVNDEDEGLARTLAALDRELARGQRMIGFLDGLFAIPEGACRMLNRSRRRTRSAPRDDSETYAV